MSPLGQLFRWLAHEYLVPRLAANKSFQQFAIKLDNIIQNQQQYIKNQTESVTKQNQESFHMRTKPLLDDPDVRELIQKIQQSSVMKRLSGIYSTIRNEYNKEFSSKKRS